jgi:DNA-binding SARP family transcriptional activator/predicted ATPase
LAATNGGPAGIHSTPCFELRTFGGLELLDGAGTNDPSLASRPRKLAVLSWLALRPRRSATRDTVVGVFWPERDEHRALNSLSDALSHLRRVIGQEALVSRAREIVVADDAPLRVDALDLCAAAAAEDHARVVALYGGPFLEGMYIREAPAFDDWRDRERARFARLFGRSAMIRCGELARAQQWDECRGLAERWLDADPTSADAAMSLLQALRAPETHTAHARVVSAYQALVRRLERDYGVGPAASVTELANASAAAMDAAPRSIPTTASLSGAEPRMVGRVRERAALWEMWERAAAGRGSLTCVSGEPGIGKTTLVEKVLADIARDAGAPIVAHGRCSERLAGTDAYLPLLDALDTLLRGSHGLRVARIMKELAPTWYVSVTHSTPEQLAGERALLGTQATSRGRMMRELGSFVDELCRVAPVVFFFDDVHWSDASTIDALSYLATRISEQRLGIIVAIRPAELQLANHPFVRVKFDMQSRGVCRETALDFLSVHDVAEFVDRELPQHALPADFAAMIHARTEGSPLFMTDLVRYLRTEGTVSNADGAWRLTAPVPDIARSLPESIRAMIQRKTEQISSDDRSLLAEASVQGNEFDTTILAAVARIDVAKVEERLESLDRVHGFVRRFADRTLPNGAVSVRYRFVHVLYQNALVTSLSPSRRARLSAQTADALLAAYGDASSEIAVGLAQLFEAARDASRAVDHLVIAAESALRIFAHHEAVVLARRGLSLLSHFSADERAEREMRLLTTLGVALGAIHGMAAAEVGEIHHRAYAIWKRLGARPSLFAVAGSLWTYHAVAANLDVAMSLGEELMQMADVTGAPPMRVVAGYTQGITLHHLGRHREALRQFDMGRDAYSLELRPHFVDLPIDAGVACVAESARVLWVLGYPDRGIERAREGVALARQLGHPESLGFANLFGAFVHHLLDEPAEALEYADAVLTISRERDVATTFVWGLALHGRALGLLGRVDDGVAELRESLSAQKAAGALVARPQFDWMLGDLLLRAERYDEADAAADDGLATSASTDDKYWDSELLRLKGDLVLARGGNASDAESFFISAIADAASREAKSLELRAATSLAKLSVLQGDRDRARRVLGPLVTWFDAGLATSDLGAARALMRL